MITYNIRLDETKPGSQCALQGFRVGEGGVRSINIILHSASVPVTIPADALAFLHCKKPGNTECVISTTVESSIIRIGVTQQMCAASGTVNCEVKVYNAARTQVLYSAMFDIYVQEALSESGIVSSNEYSGLSDVMNGITYVFVKYSDNEPTQDSDMKDTAANWMGVYSGTSHTAPTAYTSYTWYERKGATGETGATGAKGDKGDKGDTGTGLDIKGTYADLAALQSAVTNPSQGDMYNVGSSAPYTIYMWDTVATPPAWVSQGQLQGPKGDKGEKGDTGDQGPQGAPGAGVPTGGAQGQALLKASAADRDTEWGDLPEKATSLTALLDAGDWTYNTDHYEQTIQVAWLETDGYCYIVSAAPDSAGEYAKRGVLMQDVTVANTATFHADSAPETDITAYIAKLQEG